MRRRWCVSDDDETQELYRCARVRLAKRTTAGWSLSCAAGIRADSQWPARSIPQCGLPKSGSGSSCVASPWRAANLGRSRLFRRPEPAESRLRAELPALQLQTDPLPKYGSLAPKFFVHRFLGATGIAALCRIVEAPEPHEIKRYPEPRRA